MCPSRSSERLVVIFLLPPLLPLPLTLLKPPLETGSVIASPPNLDDPPFDLLPPTVFPTFISLDWLLGEMFLVDKVSRFFDCDDDDDDLIEEEDDEEERVV